MSDTQVPTGFTVENPGPLSGPNPFGFADLREAREALHSHIWEAIERELAELRGVTSTIYALAISSAEMRDERCEFSADGFVYLSDRLHAVQRAIDEWHSRADQLARIVNAQDLDVLSTLPAYRDDD